MSMDIARNVQGKIDTQDLLPYPTTVSQNVDFYADKARQALREMMQSILEEFVGIAFTTDMTTDQYDRLCYC